MSMCIAIAMHPTNDSKLNLLVVCCVHFDIVTHNSFINMTINGTPHLPQHFNALPVQSAALAFLRAE
jgi:hypothetical protein